MFRRGVSMMNKLFLAFLTFQCVTFTGECGKSMDYDMVNADELFANPSSFGEKNETEDEKLMMMTSTTTSFPEAEDQSSTSFAFTDPDSPIGYEVPCGMRGGSDVIGHTLNLGEHRIVGGIRAYPGEFPWQVSLQLLSGWFARHICGGSILSSYWVVTAGHCIANLKPQAISVVAGDHDLFKLEGTEQRVNVVRIVDAGYSKENLSTDIALLQLGTALKFGRWVAPICLPKSTKQYMPGDFAIVSGWGKLTEGGKLPNILHFVKLPIIPFNQCHKIYDSINFGKYINKCQLCCGYERGGSDSCQGDSGGPLVCQHSNKRYYLCGIISWGVGCARPNLPGVYTEVPCYSDWIKSVLYNVDNVVSKMPPYK